MLVMVRFAAVAAAAVLCSGCLESAVIDCKSHLCPQGTQCSEAHGCISSEQLDICEGEPEGEACRFEGAAGRCVSGACIVNTCGDGVRTDPEPCDGSDVGTATCDDGGFHGGGPLGCTASCTLVFDACEGRCGDGVVNGPESCDGDALDFDCIDFGYYDADGLACTESCSIDLDGCSGRRCGDGVLDPEEDCEGSLLGGLDCTDLDFYAAPGLACDSACRFDVSGCQQTCGDGVVHSDYEMCDGERPEGFHCIDYFFDRGLLGCSAGCAPDFFDCAHNGYQLLKNTAGLDSIWGWSTSDVVAVGGAGLILRYDGEDWIEVASPVSADLNGVWGASPDDIYAVGAGGVVVHFNGSSWTENTPMAVDLEGIWGSDATNIYAVGGDGEIHHNDGGGWTLDDSGQANVLNAVWGTPNGDVFAVGDDGVILHKQSGASWVPMVSGTNRDLTGVWGLAADDLWASGAIGVMLHYDGTTWTPMRNPNNGVKWTPGGDENGVYFTGAGTIPVWFYDGISWWEISQPQVVDSMWADGTGRVFGSSTLGPALFDSAGWALNEYLDADAIWGTDRRNIYSVHGSSMQHFDGRNWEVVDTSPPADFCDWFLDVHGSGPDNIYAVGECLRVAHWDGVEWTWVAHASETSTDWFRGVWVSSDGEVFAVGEVDQEDGLVPNQAAAWRFNGASWSRQVTGVTNNLNAVWGSSSSDVFAVGGGTIVHFDGTDWTPQPNPASGNLEGVWGTGPNDVWAVGSGEILHYDGSSWTIEFEDAGALLGVWGSGPDDVFFFGSGLWHHNGAGIAPIKIFGPEAIQDAWGGNGNVFFARVEGYDRGHQTYLRNIPWSKADSETSCTNTYDDDDDGAMDCADSDCSGEPRCETTETTCDDRFDNDGDDTYDCGDPDCAAECECSGAVPIRCGQSIADTTAGAPSTVADYGCGIRATTGAELVYSFVPSVSTTVTIDLTGLGADLDLAVVGQTPSRECDVAAECIDVSQTVGDESVSFFATRGETYYLFVDGFDGAEGTFTLDASCW